VRRHLNRIPAPILSGIRWVWRRLPPPDPRFLLQNLESEQRRLKFLRSPHYRRFADREAQYWSEQIPTETSDGPDSTPCGEQAGVKNLLEHPTIRREMNRRAGLETRDIWEWLVKQDAPAEHGLVLGAGNGAHCRMLIDGKIARRVTAYDIAEELVEKANTQFARYGYPIDYQAMDLNFARFPPRTFDLCLAMHVLHHFINLETLFSQLAGSLTVETGRLVMEEYVGPRYLEFPKIVRDKAQDWFKRLPTRLRRAPDGQSTIECLDFFDRWWIQRHSPFESIRSDRILPALEQSMRIDHMRPLGGGLLMPLLHAIIGNFDPADEEANGWIQRIMADDMALTEANEIPNFYVFVVARPR